MDHTVLPANNTMPETRRRFASFAKSSRAAPGFADEGEGILIGWTYKHATADGEASLGRLGVKLPEKILKL